jgi:hypothetical protein
MAYRFPFGQAVERLEQVDRTAKRVFVLGVYASAVHARWSLPGGRGVRALAVASEPSIFWTGHGVEAIISSIDVPDGCGTLTPAAEGLNGPSGIALDARYLEPLGVSRDSAWLCDLLPEARLNSRQAKALGRDYTRMVEEGRLPAPTVPPVPARFADETRVDEIVQEVVDSEAEVMITLGDIPLREFAARFGAPRKLADFGRSPDEYGRLHPLNIGGRAIALLPLVHPRQAASLGGSSKAWSVAHEDWTQSVAGRLL